MRKDPFSKKKAFHRGVDFIAKAGTPVYAMGDGVVEEIGRMGGYGKIIEIRHSPQLVSAYAHLQGIELLKECQFELVSVLAEWDPRAVQQDRTCISNLFLTSDR